MTRLLGAILAGGKASRFGSDKAAALAGGVALIDHVAARLRPQVDRLVVSGRDWPGLARIDDRPAPGLGPLGGLAGALDFALSNGFDAVLAGGCDLPDLPPDLRVRLGDAPAVVAGQPLLGLWPAAMAPRLIRHLETGTDRSMTGWIAHSGVRQVTLPMPIANINRPEDLVAFIGGDGVIAEGRPPSR